MSTEFITELLKQINYPGFSRDIVSFGLIQETHFEDGNAFVKVELSSADNSLPKTIKEEIEKLYCGMRKLKKLKFKFCSRSL